MVTTKIRYSVLVLSPIGILPTFLKFINSAVQINLTSHLRGKPPNFATELSLNQLMT